MRTKSSETYFLRMYFWVDFRVFETIEVEKISKVVQKKIIELYRNWINKIFFFFHFYNNYSVLNCFGFYDIFDLILQKKLFIFSTTVSIVIYLFFMFFATFFISRAIYIYSQSEHCILLLMEDLIHVFSHLFVISRLEAWKKQNK